MKKLLFIFSLLNAVPAFAMDFQINQSVLNEKLVDAVFNNRADLVTCLLSFGAEPNLSNESNKSLLHIAVMNGFDDVVSLLIRAGADIEAKTINGSTPLLCAAQYGQFLLFKKLLFRYNTNIDALTHNDSNVLHCAAVYGHLDIVDYVLQHYNRLNIPSRTNGSTALIFAAFKGHYAVVNRLIKDEKTDIAARNSLGCSAFMVAAQFGYLNVIQLLLATGEITRDEITEALLLIDQSVPTTENQRVKGFLISKFFTKYKN